MKKSRKARKKIRQKAESAQDNADKICLWTYRDRPKLGYHFDAYDAAARRLRDGVSTLSKSAGGLKVFELAAPPDYVMESPRLGRQPRWFKLLKLQPSKEKETIDKELELIEHEDELTVVLTTDDMRQFIEALDRYLDGAWDFNYGNLWFWPYLKWGIRR